MDVGKADYKMLKKRNLRNKLTEALTVVVVVVVIFLKTPSTLPHGEALTGTR